MSVIRKKTRKKIAKQVKKMVKQHGPEIMTGIAAAAATSAIHAVQDRGKTKSKKEQKQ